MEKIRKDSEPAEKSEPWSTYSRENFLVAVPFDICILWRALSYAVLARCSPFFQLPFFPSIYSTRRKSIVR